MQSNKVQGPFWAISWGWGIRKLVINTTSSPYLLHTCANITLCFCLFVCLVCRPSLWETTSISETEHCSPLAESFCLRFREWSLYNDVSYKPEKLKCSSLWERQPGPQIALGAACLTAAHFLEADFAWGSGGEAGETAQPRSPGRPGQGDSCL